MNLLGKTPFCVFFFYIVSCGPKIQSFTAAKRMVSSRDSVHLEWKVRGNPVLDFYRTRARYFAGDSIDILNFNLTVRKGTKEPARQVIQVRSVSDPYRDYLDVPISGQSGDTLIFYRSKDTMYREFHIESVASRNNRIMIVVHGGREILLSDSGVRMETFRGLDYEGGWQIRTLKTPEEKRDSTRVPDEIILTVYMQLKKP